MSCVGGVGQGVTLSLDVDGLAVGVRSLQMPEWVSEAVDFSSLDNSDWMCFLPASLADPGIFTAEIYFQTEQDLPSLKLVQVATITFPIQDALGAGNVAKASLVGSGFVTSVGFPNAAIAEPMITTMSFKYDGNGTVPAFTKEAIS